MVTDEELIARSFGLERDPTTGEWYSPRARARMLQVQGGTEPTPSSRPAPSRREPTEPSMVAPGARTETERHRAAIQGAHGNNPLSPFDDRKPGFIGGMWSGIVHDIPRMGVMLGDAYNTNWGPLGGEPGDTHEDRLALIEHYNRERQNMGEWTDLSHVFDEESLLQNAGDFTLWFRETLGRTFPAMAAGVAAYASGAGPAATVATAAAGAYPFILSEMLDRNYQETTAQGNLDYNATQTIGLAIPSAAVEGLSTLIVPARLAGPVLQNIARRVGGQTVSNEVRERILLTMFKEIGIGAATGASEEAIQSGIERIAAPGVEFLSPEAFREYAWSALGGALLEGPLGGGLYLGSKGINRLTEQHSIGGRDADAVDQDRRQRDEIISAMPSFVPANVSEINAALNAAKNDTFQDTLSQIRGNAFNTPDEARAHLLESSRHVQNMINAVTPPNVQPVTLSPEDVQNLSDQEAVNLAEISMAALAMTQRGYDPKQFSLDNVFNTTNPQVNADRKFLYEYRHSQLINPDFAGSLKAVHNGQVQGQFTNLSEVPTEQRYDFGDGVYGPYTYFDEDGSWSGGQTGTGSVPYAFEPGSQSHNVALNFKKAFVMTPDTAPLLAEQMGVPMLTDGPAISQFLASQGYDGLIIRGFDELYRYDDQPFDSEERYARLHEVQQQLAKSRIDPNKSLLAQNQIISFAPDQNAQIDSTEPLYGNSGNYLRQNTDTLIKKGNYKEWQPFTREQIAIMSPLVSTELANALRTLSRSPTKVLPESMNVWDAIRGLSKRARQSTNKIQQDFIRELNNRSKQRAMELVQSQNPILDVIAPFAKDPVYGSPPTEEAARWSMTEQELRDALLESGMRQEDIPEGASRDELSEVLARQLEVNKRQRAESQARLKQVPAKTQERMKKAYNDITEAASKAGIDPRVLLNMPQSQRIGFVRNRVPEGQSKKLDDAFKALEQAVDEIQTESLLEETRKAFDNMLREGKDFDPVVTTKPELDYSNVEQVRLDPGLVNSPQAVDIALKSALPGKINEAIRSAVKGAIQSFGTNQRQRGMLTSLVYSLNTGTNLNTEEAKTLFYTLRDLNFWTPEQLKAMRGQADQLAKKQLQQGVHPDIAFALDKDFNRSPLPDDVVLAEAFSDLIVGGKTIAGPTVPQFMRAANTLKAARNSSLANILGNSWNSHEVKNFMAQTSAYELGNAIMEARQRAMEVSPEALRLDEVFQDASGVVLKGSDAFDTRFKFSKVMTTLQQQAKRIPALANLIDYVRSRNYAIEQLMNEFKKDFMTEVPFGNPEEVARAEAATARLDIMSLTGQRMDRRNKDGQLIYRDVDPATGKLVDYLVSKEDTEKTDRMLRMFKKIPLAYQKVTMHKILKKSIPYRGGKLGDPGTLAQDVFDWIDTQQKALDNMAKGETKNDAKRMLEEVEMLAHALELQEALLDPAVPYYPHMRTTPDTMFQTFHLLDKDGKEMENPDAGPTGDNKLKITLEIGYDPKTRKPTQEQLAQAKKEAEDWLNRVYKPHYGAASLKAMTPNERTRGARGDLGDIGFENAIQDFNNLLRSTELSSKEQRAIIQEMRDRRRKRNQGTRMAGQAQSYIRMSANIGGYSRDYITTIGEYLSGAPWVIANDQYAETFRRVDDMLNGRTQDIPKDQLNEHFPQEQREFLKRAWEYMTEPANDLTWVRQINFFYALGFNLSTAMLNLFTLPTVIYPSLMMFNTSMVNNAKVFGKGIVTARKIITNASKKARDQGADIKGQTLELQYALQDMTKELEVAYGKEKASVMMQILLPMQNHLQQTIIEDNFTRGRVEGIREARQNETRSKIKNMMDKTQLFAGYPLHMVERFTRLSAFLSYADLMVNKDGSVNQVAVKQFLNSNANNEMINAMLKNRNLENELGDPRVVQQIATLMIQDTHGVYDKTGRGGIQRGWAGAVFFPFMTYPLTILEFMYNTAFHMGVPGKMTFALMMGMFATFAGMSAVPGAETWKELWEVFERFVKGRQIDADERINWVLTQELGIPPEHARAINGGVLAYLNMDMHRRIGIPLPFENLMSFMANPTSSWAASKITGVPGRVFLDLAQGHPDRLLPVFAQNIIKATEWNSTGASTMNGVTYLTPEQITWDEIFFRLSGVQPMSITEANQNSRTWRDLEDQFTRPAVQVLMRDLEDIEYRIYWNREAGNDEVVRQLTEAFNERLWDFRQEFAENGALPPPELIRSIRQRVSNHVFNRVNPGMYAWQELPGQRQPQFEASGESRWGRNSLERRAEGRDR